MFKDAVSCCDKKGHCFTVGVVVMQLRGKGDRSPAPSAGVEVETVELFAPHVCLYGVHGHFTFL